MKTFKTIALFITVLIVIASFSNMKHIKDPEIEKNIKKWDSILTGQNIKREFNDTLLTVLQKPDSVVFNTVKILEKFDSIKKIKYTVNTYETKENLLQEQIASLKFVLLSDSTYVWDKNFLIKHDYTPELFFSFFRNKQKVNVYYSPKSNQFGFSHKSYLFTKYYRKNLFLDDYINKIKQYFNVDGKTKKDSIKQK